MVSMDTRPTAMEMNPNHPLRILSLDGGGVRGLSSLIILEDLMESVAKHEKKLGIRAKDDVKLPKPCDYFDIIGGTSTGGIIAILLARLRLDVRECILIYSKLAAEIFKKDRALKVVGVKIPTGNTRFSGAVLERTIKDALVQHGYVEDEPMWDDSLFEAVGNTDISQNIWAMIATSMPAAAIRPHNSRRSSWFKKRSRSMSQLLVKQPQAAAPLDNAEYVETIDSNVSSTFDLPKPLSRQGIPKMSRSATTRRSTGVSSSGLPLKKCNTWKMHSQDAVYRKKGSRGCRALVVASLKNALGTAALLSTYNPNADTTIWQALRATSAAPTFFEEITFGVPKVTYLDGGMGFNNPCTEIVQEARDVWPGRSIGIVVSIGTGLQTIPSVKKGANWLPCGLGADISLISALGSMATSTARVHNEMQRLYSGSNTRYYRFDVDTGMANISLEEWMKEDEMTSLTEQYMHDPRQLKRAQHVGELIVKFSALPPQFEILPTQFSIGMDGRDIERGAFKLVDLDFKTGRELGINMPPPETILMARSDHSSPPGKCGLAVDANGSSRKVLPVAQDLDSDGFREEVRVVSCIRADDICLRAQLEGIPQGKYKIDWILAFTDVDRTLKLSSPEDLVFSVGKPWHKTTFSHRFVDVRITPDIVPALLRPDAVRIRTGEALYAEKKGKSWIEIKGNEDVEVGLDGVLGFIISKKYRKGDFIGGWHFGGVRMTPIFDSSGEEELKRYESS